MPRGVSPSDIGASFNDNVKMAPASASSIDGQTRTMVAYGVFQAAQAEYAKLGESPTAEQESACHRSCAAKCRELAVAQGGLYIKAAQLVASLQGGAGEALPKEYVEEFRSLTDAVPPRSFGDVRAVAEADLGQPLVPDLVASVDAWPIAAASLAQVHRAVPLLRQSSSEQLVENCTPQDSKLGETLALKLQYPNLKDQLSSDLAVMKQMAPFVRPAGKDVGWLLDDIERFVFRELDFRNEASNAEAARAAILAALPYPNEWEKKSRRKQRRLLLRDRVLVPKVVRELSGQRVLATEFVEGLTRLDDPGAISQQGLEPLLLGTSLSEAFAELSLVHGLVHGDPHAGNVYGRLARDENRTGGEEDENLMQARGGYSQVVILDHGLYHKLGDRVRLCLCALIVACARPWPSSRRVRRLVTDFVVAVNAPSLPEGGKAADTPTTARTLAAALLPALISPAFAFASVRGPKDLRALRAASRGRLPEGTTLDDVWSTLVGLRGTPPKTANDDSEEDSESSSSSAALGLLHSMGYVRGLQNALRLPEEYRVRALVLAAERALWKVERKTEGSGDNNGDAQLQRKLWWAVLRVNSLFFLLRVFGFLSRAFEWLGGFALLNSR